MTPISDESLSLPDRHFEGDSTAKITKAAKKLRVKLPARRFGNLTFRTTKPTTAKKTAEAGNGKTAEACTHPERWEKRFWGPVRAPRREVSFPKVGLGISAAIWLASGFVETLG